MSSDQDERVDRLLRQSGEEWRASTGHDLQVRPEWFGTSPGWRLPAWGALAATVAVGALLVAIVGQYLASDQSVMPGASPSGRSGAVAMTQVQDGPFRLQLVLPQRDWKPGEPITGTAILGFAPGSTPTTNTLFGSGNLIAFSYAEVGGIRVVDPLWTADCARHPLSASTPITVDLSKSGIVGGDEPDADFQRAFLTDPEVRLPAGIWDIAAIAQFSDGASCSGHSYTMKATVRVTVTGGLPSSPGPAFPEPNPRGAYVIELSSGGSGFTPITVGAEGAGCERLLADADANRICLIANNLDPPLIGAEAYGALNSAPSPAFHALVWRARADADPSVCGRGGLEAELLDRCLAEAQAADYSYAAGQMQIRVPIGGAVPSPSE